jgi:hypothetical protein
MTPLRQILSVVCLVVAFIANAGEPLAPKAKDVAKQAISAELQPLQGKWEGVMVGDKAGQKITLSVTGTSLHFFRDADFWFETTIALPAGKVPRQFHATIKRCPPSQESSINEVVRTFFKIEDGTLTLATFGDATEETPKGFDAAQPRYEFRKVQPEKKSAEPSKAK